MNYSQIRPGFIEKMNEFLYSDVKKINRPPLVAHYTSLEVLESILKTDTFWFSNPLFMNDIEEVSFGINEGVNLVWNMQELSEACGTQERTNIFYQVFNNCFLEFKDKNIFSTYVLCFSEHNLSNNDGNLSMWRGYGSNGNGVAIILDFQKIMGVGGSPFIFDQVHYDSREKRIELLKDKMVEFSKFIKSLNATTDELDVAAQLAFERIKLFALYTKHNGFEEEKEWRFVYLKEKEGDKLGIISQMCGYHIGPNGIEPKLKMKIKPIPPLINEDINLNTLIQKIILGPGLSDPLRVNAVLTMLDRCGKPALKEKVVASTIPFRSK